MSEAKPKETKKSEAKPKETFKEGENDFQDYQKFAELKFLQWDGERYEKKKLKESALKEFEKLEAKFKDYKGNKPKVSKTVFMGIGTNHARIVEGYAVPASLYAMFEKKGSVKHFF